MAKRISNIARFPSTDKLEKYLGVPSITGHIHAGSFQHVLDRVERRLDGWKAKLLSLAGRTILAQAVLTTIPLYPMQSTMLHVSLCTAIYKKVRRFIWGSSQGRKKIHLVNWDVVTQSKENGGLGIKKMRDEPCLFG